MIAEKNAFRAAAGGRGGARGWRGAGFTFPAVFGTMKKAKVRGSPPRKGEFMMKKRMAALLLAVCLFVPAPLSGCREAPETGSSQEAESESAVSREAPSEPESSASPEESREEEAPPEEETALWTPAVKGLRWGMSMEEALTALGVREPKASWTADDSSFVTVPGIHPTDRGVNLSEVQLQFLADDSGIPGYEGLMRVYGTCASDDIDALLSALNEEYADWRRTDGTASPAEWASGSMRSLGSGDALAERLTEALSEALPEGTDADAFLLSFLESPLVSYSLRTTGEHAGLFMAEGTNEVMRLALEGEE